MLKQVETAANKACTTSLVPRPASKPEFCAINKMDKESAIKEVEKFITDREFSWESISIVDKEPVETEKFWIFKNYWEPRESLRGNNLEIFSDRPRIIIDKESGVIKEVTRQEFQELLNDLY